MRSRNAILSTLAAMLAIGATVAPAAFASPPWRFEGKSLENTETVVGNAVKSTLTIPGLTTTCQNLGYGMKIFNTSGTGKGELVEASFEECSTDSGVCTVGSISAQTLPWLLHLTTVSGKDYVFLEGVKVFILYEGEECPLEGVLVKVTGTAAGFFNNENSTISFTPSTIAATGTALKALGTTVEWSGLFSTEATGVHAGQKLEG